MSNEGRARLGRRKFSVGDSAYVNDQAPADYRERTGIITEIGPGKSEYPYRIRRRADPYHWLPDLFVVGETIETAPES